MRSARLVGDGGIRRLLGTSVEVLLGGEEGSPLSLLFCCVEEMEEDGRGLRRRNGGAGEIVLAFLPSVR